MSVADLIIGGVLAFGGAALVTDAGVSAFAAGMLFAAQQFADAPQPWRRRCGWAALGGLAGLGVMAVATWVLL